MSDATLRTRLEAFAARYERSAAEAWQASEKHFRATGRYITPTPECYCGQHDEEFANDLRALLESEPP